MGCSKIRSGVGTGHSGSQTETFGVKLFIQGCLGALRSLLEYLDPELYDRLKKLVSGTKAKAVVDVDQDADHLYFCYRWFLLDFKREFPPEMVLPTALIIETLNTTKVFTVWEMAWAAREVTSTSLPVFIAYSILQLYRSVSSMFT